MPEFPVTNACRSRVRALCLILSVTAVATACAPKADAPSDDTHTAPHATNFKVTDAQRAKLVIVTIEPVKFHPTLEATGTVAFNGDKSTAVLSPISGPVARIVTTLGASVVAGQTLATVSSPDFATAVATYRKTEEMVRNTNRILTLDETLFANDALALDLLGFARGITNKPMTTKQLGGHRAKIFDPNKVNVKIRARPRVTRGVHDLYGHANIVFFFGFTAHIGKCKRLQASMEEQNLSTFTVSHRLNLILKC